MPKNAVKSKMGIPLIVTALMIVSAAIIGQSWAWTATAVFAVAAGIFFAKTQGYNGKRSTCVVEMSASQLSRMQELALSRGLRSISSNPVGPQLDQDQPQFAIARSTRHRKVGEFQILRCIAILNLRDGGSRVGELDIDAAHFAELSRVEDRKRADELIRKHAGSPIYGD